MLLNSWSGLTTRSGTFYSSSIHFGLGFAWWDLQKATGGQIVHSEPSIHQSKVVQPCGCDGGEMLVEQAWTDRANESSSRITTLHLLDPHTNFPSSGNHLLVPTTPLQWWTLFTLFERPTCNDVWPLWTYIHWKFWFNEVSRLPLPRRRACANL